MLKGMIKRALPSFTCTTHTLFRLRISFSVINVCIACGACKKGVHETIL